MTTAIEKPSSLDAPQAEFVEDVDEYMKRPDNESAEAVLRRLEESHSKYKYMEAQVGAKKARLKTQVPSIKTTLDIVRHMKGRESAEPLVTSFQLSDQLYTKATIPPTEKVCLWLGANVMLEYDINEAEDMLDKNHTAALESLRVAEDDL